MTSPQEIFRDVFDSMSSGVLVTDLSGVILLLNPAARSYLQLPESATIEGRPIEEAIPWATPFLVDTRQGAQRQIYLELPGGRRPFGYTTTTPPSGHYRITVFRDVSALIEAERGRKRIEQLAQVGEIAASLSHEIRNPLAAILAGLQALERNVLLSSDDNFTLQAVLEEVRRLAKIIDELLDSTRQHELRLGPVRVETLVRHCVATHRQLAERTGVQLELVEGPLGTTAIVDDDAMKRILGNIIRNALDVSKARDHVQVGWRELDREDLDRLLPGFKGAACGIFVEDQGPGIPTEIRDQLFEPFVTTKPSGTGLGLAVAQELATAQGGAINLQTGFDPRGGGTRFELLLCSGERSRCYQCNTDCIRDFESCKIPDAEAWFNCWTIRGQVSRLETGNWDAGCLKCPVFESGDLAHFFDARPKATESTGSNP